MLPLKLSCGNCNITAGVVIAKPALFLFHILHTSPYCASNALTIISAAMIAAEPLFVDNATVPLFAILTIIH